MGRKGCTLREGGSGRCETPAAILVAAPDAIIIIAAVIFDDDEEEEEEGGPPAVEPNLGPPLESLHLPALTWSYLAEI